MSWTTAMPVSVETRFVRFYPQMETKGIVPFINYVQSNPAASFFVASGSRVYIRSSVTEALY
jgi:hypothetical protein